MWMKDEDFLKSLIVVNKVAHSTLFFNDAKISNWCRLESSSKFQNSPQTFYRHELCKSWEFQIAIQIP
jgi:hypothetical protein